jgi:hypothetical protein
MVAITQGKPRPRNTLTELLPFILPIELSAVFSFKAAVLLANVSGILVPKATKVIAVIGSSSPTKQPNIDARSLMTAVINPITANEIRNVGHPPRYLQGGMKANRI